MGEEIQEEVEEGKRTRRIALACDVGEEVAGGGE